MITKLSSALVFTLAILTFLAEARTGDAVQVKLRYNLNFQASDSEVQDILKKGDLESHGFIKEVSSRQVKEPGTNTVEYQESYLYYKVVNCSRTQEVEQELDTLIPGIFGDNFDASKLNKATNSTDKMGQCRVGLELIFRKPGNDFGRQTADMDESEEADEGSLKINSGIGVGPKTSNLWGGRRRRRYWTARRRFRVTRIVRQAQKAVHRTVRQTQKVAHQTVRQAQKAVHHALQAVRRVTHCRPRTIRHRRRFSYSNPGCQPVGR